MLIIIDGARSITFFCGFIDSKWHFLLFDYSKFKDVDIANCFCFFAAKFYLLALCSMRSSGGGLPLEKY